MALDMTTACMMQSAIVAITKVDWESTPSAEAIRKRDSRPILNDERLRSRRTKARTEKKMAGA